MVSCCGCCEGEEGGGEEHGFVVRVGDEEADALVGEGGVGGAGDVRCEEPCCGDE